MRIARFHHDGRAHTGLVLGDEVADLGDLDPIALLIGAVAAEVDGAARLPLADVRLLPPVAAPRKFLAIGLNYKDHIEETGLDTPKFPMFFNKQSTAANGPYEPIHLPRVSDKLDYEGELGFIIGKRCRHVPRDRAHEVIAGYCVCNDVSNRFY